MKLVAKAIRSLFLYLSLRAKEDGKESLIAKIVSNQPFPDAELARSGFNPRILAAQELVERKRIEKNRVSTESARHSR